MLDLGGVVGYIDEIQHKIRCKLGRKIVGMNFQTRSSAYSVGGAEESVISLLMQAYSNSRQWRDRRKEVENDR